ncbi:hypothetical protein AB6A40_005021 [Gnathostoma spinigerum]|uniref:G-protein coupled receptors family 1 profile domain-containing protein n=1 Tax=Gnathostoma spinigerum TaxID=75299 RepID=A0ABD6EGE2_9BILA
MFVSFKIRSISISFISLIFSITVPFFFSRGSAICTLATLTFVTFVLLSPMIAYALSEEIILREVYVHNPDRVLRVKIYKCLDNMEGDLFTVFTLYMFVLGFAIPVSLIVLFYGLLVRRLFLRSRSIATSQVPVNRIAGYTMAISIFFVVCWSPYWMATLYGLYRSTKKVAFHASPTFIYVMYGIHALPYVNSASNWLLYGMLNGQLMRRANVHRQTMKNVHNNVNSLVLKKALSPSEKNDCDDSIIVPRTSDSLL